MRLTILLACLLAGALVPVYTAAQPPSPDTSPTAADQEGAPGTEDEDEDEEEEGDDDETPRLRQPSLAMPDVEVPAEAGGEEEAEAETEEEAEAEESAAGMRVTGEDKAAPPSSDPTVGGWTAPESVLSLHGYFRLRTELWDTFFLGRDPIAGQSDMPFEQFRPIDRQTTPAGGCRDAATNPDDEDPCGNSDRLRFANLRLRLRPTLSLSDDVRVHMMVDVLDNVVLGSTPEGSVWKPPTSTSGFERAERTPGVPLDSFAASVDPPTAYRNSLEDSIRVRRAWAEVTNRGLGQLRFGRMGSHWGLGVLANGGDGIDADFQSDVDRLMGITKIAGFYLVGAWDWAGEGFVGADPLNPRSITRDVTQKDDIRQLVFAVARRTDAEEQRDRLQRGDWVLNGGFYFVWRKQGFSSAGISDPYNPNPDGSLLVRRKARAFIPDLWGQFLWKGLRLEAEAVLIQGEIQNVDNISFTLSDYNILQFGYALETEYRLLEDKLGLTFHTGYATGDADVDGLHLEGGLPVQRTDDKRISTFRFHPNYRIDLILFRNILGRIAGAYYFKPGISYDLIKNPFGQQLGLRFDLIYSRAAQEVQTYGADPNLGVEFNISAYYRSEDGPEVLDGFYAQFQYGFLKPLAGLGYPSFRGRPMVPSGNPGLKNAQALRLLLGVQF